MMTCSISICQNKRVWTRKENRKSQRGVDRKLVIPGPPPERERESSGQLLRTRFSLPEKMSTAVEQLLDEKCSFGGGGDVRLGLSPPVVFFQGNEDTMNLEQVQNESELSVKMKMKKPSSTERRRRGQMKILYGIGGEAVLLLVNHKNQLGPNYKLIEPAPLKSSSSPIYSTLPPAPPDPIQKQQQPHHHHLRKLAADLLPMQRRSSLSRFLESRKNRMMARAPYN